MNYAEEAARLADRAKNVYGHDVSADHKEVDERVDMLCKIVEGLAALIMRMAEGK